ncbi:hypothetical protein AB4851_07905 [Burkholderia sp. 22PA0099]|uniref:hypothetical protein n=1 Tax=Burkholderia sp. 22PA0099 TaxID=3237372 RepID=UPI0039C1E8FF
MRELIVLVVRMPVDYHDEGRDGLAVELLFQALRPRRVEPLHRPLDRRDVTDATARAVSALSVRGRRTAARPRPPVRSTPAGFAAGADTCCFRDVAW